MYLQIFNCKNFYLLALLKLKNFCRYMETKINFFPGLLSILFAINVDNGMLNEGDPDRISRSALSGQGEPEITSPASGTS
jgi:hypothetical protein